MVDFRHDYGLKGYFYDYVRLRPEEQIGVHTQNSWELSCILRGSRVRLVGGTREPFQEGEVVLVAPGVPHCWFFDSAVEGGVVENVTLSIGASFLEKCEIDFPELSDAVGTVKGFSGGVCFKGASAGVIAQRLVAMKEESDVERLASVIFLLGCVAMADEPVGVGLPVVVDRNEERRRAVEVFVLCNISREIRLETIASHVGLSRSSFCRWMSSRMGTTFASYLMSRRIELACSMLRQRSDMLIGEICVQSGFSDIPYFNRMFKRHIGMTPSQYRHSGR